MFTANNGFLTDLGGLIVINVEPDLFFRVGLHSKEYYVVAELKYEQVSPQKALKQVLLTMGAVFSNLSVEGLVSSTGAIAKDERNSTVVGYGLLINHSVKYSFAMAIKIWITGVQTERPKMYSKVLRTRCSKKQSMFFKMIS